MASYNNVPVLAKIKIGNTTYWMKDKDARDAIDSLEEELVEKFKLYATIEYVTGQIAAEVTRADGKYATASDLTAAIGRIATIEGDYLKAADKTELSGLITAETTRATGVEGGLDTRIRNLESRGRYLSTWDSATGLPGDYPTVPTTETGLSYTYSFKAGDYYIINNLPASGTKYMPKGSSITATRTDTSSPWVWTAPEKEAYTGETAIVVGGQFVYSTTGWNYVATAKDVAWGNITGNLSDQTDLQNALNLKADKTELHSHSNKAILDATTASFTTAQETKLSGIEAGAQVNKIESISISGSALPIVGKDVALDTVAGGELATLDADDLQTKAQTITGVTATGDLSGSVSVSSITTTPTAISSTGNVTAAGTINVTLKNNTISEVTNVGTLPTYTAGSFSGGKATVIDTTKFDGGSAATFTEGAFTPNTPTVIDTSKFNGGTAASWTGASQTKPTFTEGAFTAATLTHSEDTFAKEGIKVHIGDTTKSEDAECLYFEAVATGTASNITAFSGGSKDADTFTQGEVNFGTFDGGSAASISSGFYTAGTAASKVADTFNGGTAASLGSGFVTAGSDASYTAPTYTPGTLPTVADKTVAVDAHTFTGTEVAVSVSGSYDKATSASGSATITGASLNVGTITVAATDIETK